MNEERAINAANPAHLARVAELVKLMRKQAADVDLAARNLAAANAAFARTEQEDLPELLREVGLLDITMVDGTRVVVKPDVQAAVTQAQMPAAIEWLKANGFDGIVKTSITLEFGRGEASAAEDMAAELAESSGREVDLKTSINPQTLKAFVKERMAAGTPLPEAAFSVRPFDRAKLQEPRKR